MKKIVLTKKKGILFCITGLPGSGKLSIAKLIKNKIIQNYGPTIIINGNYIRRIFDLKKNEPQESLGNGIKFSNLCKFLTDQKVNVIFAVVNLFDKIRKKMFIIDSTLADSHSILEGFFLTKASELVRKSYEQDQTRLKGEQKIANKNKSKNDIHSVGGETQR